MVARSPPASCSAITRVFCLSHLISFCHLCNKLSLCHHFPPPLVLALSLVFPLSAIMFHSPVFHPSLCRALNPRSFALLGPHPSHFSSCSPRAVSAAVPFPPTALRFPSLFLIHFLPASGFIHPPSLQRTSPSLFPPGFPVSILHLIPLPFVISPHGFSSTWAVLLPLLSLFKA